MREIGVWLDCVRVAAKATGYEWRVTVDVESDDTSTSGERTEIGLRLYTSRQPFATSPSRRDQIVHRWADVQLANAVDWRAMIVADVTSMARKLDEAVTPDEAARRR